MAIARTFTFWFSKEENMNPHDLAIGGFFVLVLGEIVILLSQDGLSVLDVVVLFAGIAVGIFIWTDTLNTPVVLVFLFVTAIWMWLNVVPSVREIIKERKKGK